VMDDCHLRGFWLSPVIGNHAKRGEEGGAVEQKEEICSIWAKGGTNLAMMMCFELDVCCYRAWLMVLVKDIVVEGR